MTRAEEAAMKAYPVCIVYRSLEQDYEDINGCYRVGFEMGYEQAEEDLALTINDIEAIHVFLYAIKNNKTGAFTFTRLQIEQYEEVLRRFQESKNKAK